MQSAIKPWRESASLIMAGKNTFFPQQMTKFNCNYKILTLKRSDKVSFMPNSYSFPGGVLDKSDCTRDWYKLYERFGFKKDYFNKLKKMNHGPIYESDDSELPRYLSLRINAIRETFEECGILICKNARLKYQEEYSHWASVFLGDEILEWQKKVHEDASQLIEMCHQFQIYPDVCALHEWSNWLTPYILPRQFDTIFFFAAFHTAPPSVSEENEVEQLEWADPIDVLRWNNNKKIKLAPPQFYEISRLINFNDIDNLLKFAHARSFNGFERTLPYRIVANGKEVTILPGDELYPQDERIKNREVTVLNDDVPTCQVMHRVVHPSSFLNEIIVLNFTPPHNHLTPVSYNKFVNKL